MTDPLAAGMLRLLKAYPSLLPPAPTDNLGAAIERRTRDEVHACLRCGQRAQVAFVAHVPRVVGPADNRWLDLCAACADWLRRNVT
jgi:hypothetical protein